MDRLDKIRLAEKESHIETYTTNELFQQGTWLQKPIKTITDLLPLFDEYSSINILDIGSGVGRNSIPLAQHFSNIQCSIDCVDILELAIDKLKMNSVQYGVEKNIKGYVSPIEDFEIQSGEYDMIIAVSALEHIESEAAFALKLKDIQNGLKKDGVFCLVTNSEVTENDKETREPLEPQFEVNMPAVKMQELLQESFRDWDVLKSTVVPQTYIIKRENVKVSLATKVITFVVRK